MAKFTLGNEERETHITWNTKDKIATIFTADPTMQRKLDGLCEKSEEYKLVKQEDWGGNPMKYYQMPSKLLTFRLPKESHLSPEERASRAARMREMRAKKSGESA